MNINIGPLSQSLTNIVTPNTAVSFGEPRSDASFSNILSDAFGAAVQADAADKASGLELLIGQADDLSGLMLDMQKAELSLNLALQIRNRIIDSYNEVMRMQV